METTAKLPRQMLRPAEVCTILQIDPRTLRRMAEAGKLTAIKVGPAGKHRRYYADEVEALLARDTGPGAV
jgi:excisionase family DNA binding protein